MPTTEAGIKRAEIAMRHKAQAGGVKDLPMRLALAMGKAVKKSRLSAPVIAKKISNITGRELSAHMLYAMTAPSKAGDYAIDVERLAAFVQVTGAYEIYQELVGGEGLLVVDQREAMLIELGRSVLEGERIAADQKELVAKLREISISN